MGLPLETVSVRITRGWHTAYIALGSNLGEKETYLRNAVESLNQADGCRVEEVSEFLVTEPYGYTEQDDFLNGCLCLKTLLTPEELLALLHGVGADHLADGGDAVALEEHVLGAAQADA